MNDEVLLELLHEVVDEVAVALASVGDWGPSGRRDGQYAADLIADAAALDVLRRAGVGVLSEESGLENGALPIVVVVDPLDGSTNASRGIPWFATSLCAFDRDGPRVSVVANQAAARVRYQAVRGGGAWRDGETIAPSPTTNLHEAVVGISGYPAQLIGWWQFRSLGAAALDLCLVADGTLDGFVDCSRSAHGIWDYAGALLICREAGARIADVDSRDMLTLEAETRRTPVAAGSAALFDELLAARQAFS
jgi:fructose-1,6-bisphosphatase/inositol monophosphatase family enzyme